jgi:hypothetical protein
MILIAKRGSIYIVTLVCLIVDSSFNFLYDLLFRFSSNLKLETVESKYLVKITLITLITRFVKTTFHYQLTSLACLTLFFFLMGVWQGVAMDSLKYRQGPP